MIFLSRYDNMNGMTTDIYFELKEKEKDNNATTNEITNMD